MNLNDYAAQFHRQSREAGWWKPGQQNDPNVCGAKIALIHSEASEMLEGMRKGIPDDHLPHRSMEEVECADLLIRIFDYAGARGLDLDAAVNEKAEYNRTRPDHDPANREKLYGKSI